MSGSEAGAAAAPSGPVETARAFIEAIAWGDHTKVWELLAPEGRRTVLRIATKHGMDSALAARLREGTAGSTESEEFLIELVNGLRADLHGNDLDSLLYAVDTTADADAGRARVVLTAPLVEQLAVASAGLPIGSVELTADDGQWRVERLVPVRTLA